jgi:lipopolysaccharide/colanic/teichoic acid biosynthesis glycosyltransferase
MRLCLGDIPLADAKVRRIFDLCIAFIALLLATPLIFLIAIAIRLDTPGPVFFSQIRLGQHGKRFRLFKLRKFFHKTSEMNLTVTLKDDSRMTRVGRFLEWSKLDELPQFLNVLRGDMAIVGPRPELPDFADCFDGPWRAVLEHKPGLFGPSQVMFRHEAEFYPPDRDPQAFYREMVFVTKARLDLSYYPHRTLWSDVVWIARSVRALFGSTDCHQWKLDDEIDVPLLLPKAKVQGVPRAYSRIGEGRRNP